MTFLLYDDFLPAGVADEVENMFLSNYFPWGFYRNVNNKIPPEKRSLNTSTFHDDPRFEETFGFARLIGPPEEWFDYTQRILRAFLEHDKANHPFRNIKLLRVKANLLVQAPCTENPKPFPPHVDLPFPHWVVLYYVNDTDGDTLILDKMYPDKENATVLRAISPKKGRAILFDGRHYHCGTCPTKHDARVVLNYDFQT